MPEVKKSRTTSTTTTAIPHPPVCSPRLRVKEVKLFAAGFVPLAMDAPSFERTASKSFLERVDRQIHKNTWYDKGRPNITHVYDCFTNTGDNAAARRKRRASHCGTHRLNLELFMEKDVCKKLLQNAKEDLKQFQGSTMRILCMCRSGRHKSVSGTRVLEWCFAKLGLKVSTTYLTMPETCCTECTLCHVQDPEHKKLAIQMWSEA